MFIELHMIQNFAPANLNRDDTGTPKDCEFGGYRRARISSQCLKRAIRRDPAFAKATGADIGLRTRWLTRLLRQPLLDAGKPDAEVNAVTTAFAAAYAGKMDAKAKERTSVLLYLSAHEIREMVDGLLAEWDVLTGAEDARDKSINDLVKALTKSNREVTSAPDIALFGRMLAERPDMNLDAACQVAHAISTHRIAMEMDYFTAVDDLAEKEETGAGMLGFLGFNSACFYRYARIDWNQLVRNLRGETGLARQAVEGFIRAAIAAVPGGKQNSYAAHNPPSFLLAVVREDGMGWSLANAFEKPVAARRDGGIVSPSIEALDTYWGRLCEVYGTGTLTRVAALSLDGEPRLTNLGENLASSVEEWVAQALAALPGEETPA